MTDLEHVLPLWHELEAAGSDYVLATVVAVEGSSYRKPGARMLLANDGRRAGTVSGGCLEAEVARRAWWLTANGPVVERYSTLEDDGDLPYGSGCGGVVFILLERRPTARPLLIALEAAFSARIPVAIATVLDGPNIGHRVLSPSSHTGEATLNVDAELTPLVDLALESRESSDQKIVLERTLTRVGIDYRAARPGLWIFGAGDDAQPLLHLARELGWFVAVADGRSHLATKSRFFEADEVIALPIADFPAASNRCLDIHPSDTVVLMTHSFEQDSRILALLLKDFKTWPLSYIGILGPQRRTREALSAAAKLLGHSPTIDRVEQWLAQIYAPTGIDLGADTPASIALSILAEIQQTLNASTALPLRQVRAARAIAPL
jgi:xanthine dehydrogenase accessory factor